AGQSLFFFNDTATTEIYTLSLHDALPIFDWFRYAHPDLYERTASFLEPVEDRKSTRLNSSHRCISYAVFCLKKKNLDHEGVGVLLREGGRVDKSRVPLRLDARVVSGGLRSSQIRFTLRHLFLHFFFNDTATTEIYTLSLHDALPI